MLTIQTAKLTGSEAKLILALYSHGIMQRGILKPHASELRGWTGLSRPSLYKSLDNIRDKTESVVQWQFDRLTGVYTIWLELDHGKTWPIELDILVREHLSQSQLVIVRRLNSVEKILAAYLYVNERRDSVANLSAYLFSLLTQNIDLPSEYTAMATNWQQQSLLIHERQNIWDRDTLKKFYLERWKRFLKLPDSLGSFCFEKRFKKDSDMPLDEPKAS